MIPIKIRCECGQKYAFDVEPTGGRMNQTVQCPVCGTDGTTASNQMIAQYTAANFPSPLRPLRLSRSASQGPSTAPLPPRDLAAAIPNASSPKFQPKNKSFRLALGGAIASIFVLTGAVLHLRAPHQPPGSSMSLAEAKDGRPRTLAELNAWYLEPPEGQNAAAFYSRGLDALQLGKLTTAPLPLLGKGQLPPLAAPMPAALRAALTALVNSNQAALQCFTDAIKYERCRYPVDLALGYDVFLPHLPKLKNAALLLELSAILHAEVHQGERAADDILLGLGLAHSLRDEPALLSQLTRVASVSAALRALERTVNRASLPSGALSKLATAFQKMEQLEQRGEGFSRAFAAERVLSLTLLSTPQKLLPALSAPGVTLPVEQRDHAIARLNKGEKLREEQDFLETSFIQLFATRQESFPERLTADERVRQRVTEAAGKKLAILQVLLPGLAGRTATEAECLARLRLGRTAIALEQFRATRGAQYPATVSELTPTYLTDTLTDPFDGQPLRYQKSAGGYRLYSIGPDQKDGAGEPKKGNGGDIVLHVIAAPRAQEK